MAKIKKEDILESNLFGGEAQNAADFLKVLEQLEQQYNSLLKATAKKINAFDLSSAKGINDFNKESQKTNKILSEQDKILRTKEKLQSKLTNLTGKEAKEVAALRVEINRKNKINREEAKLQSETTTAYEKLSIELNQLRKRYKDVAASEGIASKNAKDLQKQIGGLDGNLKKIDANAGQYQRNVGNYGSAWGGVGGAIKNLVLGPVGLAAGALAGITAITKRAIAVQSEFQTSLASLGSILGIQGEELGFFAEQAKQIAQDRTLSTSLKDTVEAFKLVGSAKPELLENRDALADVTKQAILLSKASGDDLSSSVGSLTKVLNQYGKDASEAAKVTDILAAGAQAGAAEIPAITEALVKFGVSASGANIKLQESVGAIELLAEKGLEGAEAGTKLRNVFSILSTAEALPKEAVAQLQAAGVNTDVLADKNLTLKERLTELSKIQGNSIALTKVFGRENKEAASVLVENIDRFGELTEQVDENGVAQKQAEQNTRTFAASWQRLKNTFDALLAADNGLVEFLAPVIDFISDIIIAFDAAIDTLKPFITEVRDSFVGLFEALGLFGDEADEATDSVGVLTKVFEFLQIPLKFTLTVISFIVDAFTGLVKVTRDYIAESPRLQNVLAAIGRGFKSIGGFITDIPVLFLATKEAIFEIGRQVVEFTKNLGRVIGNALTFDFDAAGKAVDDLKETFKTAGSDVGDAFNNAVKKKRADREKEAIEDEKKLQAKILAEQKKAQDEADKQGSGGSANDKRLSRLEQLKKKLQEVGKERELALNDPNDALGEKFKSLTSEAETLKEEIKRLQDILDGKGREQVELLTIDGDGLPEQAADVLAGVEEENEKTNQVIIDTAKALNDQLQKDLLDREEKQKQFYDRVGKSTEEFNKSQQELAKQRIAEVDNEIKQRETAIGKLESLGDSQTTDDLDRLEFENKKIAELQREKQKQERRARITELTTAAIKSYINGLENDQTPLESLGNTSGGITALLAFINSLNGFKTGGYTGDVGVNDIAGVTHGKEFVIDAATTKDLGLKGASMSDFKNKYVKGFFDTGVVSPKGNMSNLNSVTIDEVGITNALTTAVSKIDIPQVGYEYDQLRDIITQVIVSDKTITKIKRKLR